MELLLQRGAQNLSYNDPYVPTVTVNGASLESKELTNETLSAADCIIITTDHSDYDMEKIVKNAKLIVDTRNATKNVRSGREKIVRLGSYK